MTQRIGYARVSTFHQDFSSQQQLLEEAGCHRIFTEKVTGTTAIEREQLREAIRYARPGDILVVTKIDRLARSIIDLNNIVHELASEGISVLFLKDNMEFNSKDDTNSMQTLLFNVLGSFAQFEADLIRERTTEGRERAKAQGKHMGRPGQSDKAVQQALQLFENRATNKMSVNDIVKVTGVPRSTIYAKRKRNGA
ncbi:recombinase family protein [Marinococcus sp. PL1-022]|uniref:recombinase family protein n=1 Tax=Marinococcus sp. PL1-022 TaxID=3095363 RepID=UPI0029C26081|nr:recombinase family protein [Marinococcus sp. PL1-022]MDX6154525.1 recombinase family protein [Marinococcus sp. PL1-022]